MAIDFSNQRILIVDSSGNMRATLSDMLRSIGFTNMDVRTMSRSVLDTIENQYYNIILIAHSDTDTYTGLQLLEEARYREIARPTTSWVLMTGDASQRSLLFALEEEPDEIIIKPFSMDDLRHRLGILCRLREALEPIERVLERNAPNRAIQLCDSLFDKSHAYYYQAQFIKGKLLLETEQPSLAEKVFDRLYWRDKNTKAGFYLAKCWYLEGKLVEAQSLLENLIKESPLLLAAHDLLSLVHEVQGHLEDAKSLLVDAARRSPTVIHRQMEAGRVLVRTGNLEQAHTAYKKSIDLGESSCRASTKAYLNLANVQRKQMESQDSHARYKTLAAIESLLNKAQKRFPNDDVLKVQSAMFMSRVYEDIEIEDDAKDAREKAASLVEKHGLSIDLESVMGPVFEPFIPIAPEPTDVISVKQTGGDPAASAKVNRMGIRNYLAGKPGQAIRFFVSAFEQDSQNVFALLNLAQLFLEAARDTPSLSTERIKMFDRYLKLAARLPLEEEAKDKYQQLSMLRDVDLTHLPEGPLADLLK